MSLLLLSLFIVLLSSPLSLVSSHCNQNDKKVLLKIKAHFNNPHVMSKWDPHTDCCSDWHGITCDEANRVKSILFTSSDLSGRIPSIVAALPHLANLIIYYSPGLIGPLPRSLAKLPHLSTLTLRNTNISGPIPHFLCDISSLALLDLTANRLTGRIPDCLAKNYSFLYLGQNQLVGPIPRSFANVHIYELVLSGNQLDGDASFLFGEKRRGVSSMDLSQNRLKFDLSNVSYPLTLTRLDLSHNQIYGSISREVSKLRNLAWIDVSYNRLCGPIPNITSVVDPFPARSFAHNKCLCGGPLPPCHH